MPQVVVDTILAQSASGCIFSGRELGGARLIVRLAEPVFPVPGDTFEVHGTEATYVDDRGLKHRQIEAQRADRIRTSGRLLGPWLQSLPGIGAERAQRLLARFGPDLLDVLDDGSSLEAVAAALAPGRLALGRKLAGMLLARFAERKTAEHFGVAEAEFYRQLEQIGVTDRRAARAMYRLIGSTDAWAKLLNHPYALAAVLDWKEADHIGLRLLVSRGDADPAKSEERLVGACDAVWRSILDTGNTVATKDLFLKQLTRVGVDSHAALEAGLAARRVLRQGDLLRPPGAAFLERAVAADIKRLSDPALPPMPAVDVRRFEDTRRPLTDEQREAIAALLERRFGILQGSAGTGKTTAMRVLVNAHLARGGSVVMATISGKAALRLSRATGRLAVTIARLLNGLDRRRKLTEEGSYVPESLPHIDEDTMVVLDEASMIDLVSWRKLLEQIPTGASIMVVGDVHQLPPVGLGQVFHDLVANGVNVSRLAQVLRQAGENPIVAVATAVREGNVPELPAYDRSAAHGVSWLECSLEELQAALDRVRADLTASGVPEEDMLFLAGLRATVDSMNGAQHLRRQEAGATGRRLGPLCGFAAVGDPVIVTRNRYDEALMNGLVGWVAGLDPLTIRFDGEAEPRTISDEASWELASAWAVTGHKAQGSEAPDVVVVLDGKRLLTREWLYTALTRATRRVVLVGSRDALVRAVNTPMQRLTGFRNEL